MSGPERGTADGGQAPEAENRHAWAEPGVEDLGGGVYRIPLPLDGDALRAVNVYALTGAGGVDLIDGGMALARARDRLDAALRKIGSGLGDVRNFFVTHIHRDHYTLAVHLRRAHRGAISLGEAERENLRAVREVAAGTREHGYMSRLRRLGAMDLLAPLDGGASRPDPADWEEPDRWVPDGTELSLASRTLRAVHTPGHTRGHVVYHDPAAGLFFAGDHVLPHITPSIGLEPAPTARALRDYLSSLRLMLTLPDARLLPAHGPVRDSTHRRVSELLAHHEQRLAEIADAVGQGNRTAYQVARAIRWTRRQRPFGDLDTMNQLLATTETSAHLEVLVARGHLTRSPSPEGADLYEPASAAPAAAY